MTEPTRPRTPESGIRRTTPPPSPPSPDFNDSGIGLSRKREREVSLEPAGNPSSTTQHSEETPNSEPKDSRAPAKKNRIHLGPTAEEDDQGSRSRSNSPPLSTSPPHEMKIKVRQISQGVEDLSWKNRQKEQNEELTDSQEAPMTTDPDVSTIEENKEESQDPDKISLDQSKPPRNGQTTSRRDSETDAGEKDKGLKRKFVERGTSAGPQEGETRNSSAESTKRHRDDSGKDDNSPKRLTPPPETEKLSPSSSTPALKLGGFMAYASTESPFASVKGQNIFTSSKSPSPKPTSPFSPGTTSKPLSAFSAPLGEPSTSTTPAKRSGFEAFASSASPFTTATRSKSPNFGPSSPSSRFGRSRSPASRVAGSGNAFTVYASGGMQSFVLPPHKRARAGSPPGSPSSLERSERNSNSTVNVLGGGGSNQGSEDEREERGSSSFGERLRAGKDDDEGSGGDEDNAKMHLTEQEVSTGEEEEETIHQVRGKLFVLSNGGWKERGTGLLKLNVRASDGGGARLVMRKEAVYTVILNITLFPGMRCTLAQDPRYLRLSAIENGAATHYNLRLANAKISKELLEEIHGNTPSA